MSGRSTIRTAMEQLHAAFSSYRISDGLEDILCDHLSPFTDSTVRDATRRLIASAARAPSVADVVLACRSIQGYEPTKAAQDWVDYWDRPEHERAEIDRARDECMRVNREIAQGIPVAQVMQEYEARMASNDTASTPRTRAPRRDEEGQFAAPGWLADW